MWQCERRKEMNRVSLPSSVGDRGLMIDDLSPRHDLLARIDPNWDRLERERCFLESP